MGPGDWPAFVRGRTSFKLPELASIFSKEIVFSPWLAAKANWFEGCMAMPKGEAPMTNGELKMEVTSPETVSTR
jgi:hypothetical protein